MKTATIRREIIAAGIAAVVGFTALFFALLAASRVSEAADRSVSGNDPAVRADMDRILDLALDLSKHAIVKKVFVPFGIVLRDNGKIGLRFFAPSGLSAPTDSNAMIAYGKQSLRAEAKSGGRRAVALVYDGRVRNLDGSVLYPDAVLVLIDHRAAPGAVSYDIPYRIIQSHGGTPGVQYLEDIGTNAEPRFAFPSSHG